MQMLDIELRYPCFAVSNVNAVDPHLSQLFGTEGSLDKPKVRIN